MNLDEHQSPREPLLLAEAFLPPYFCRRLKIRLIFKHQKSILSSVAPTATVAYDKQKGFQGGCAQIHKDNYNCTNLTCFPMLNGIYLYLIMCAIWRLIVRTNRTIQ